jgi:DNA-binding SARP family transcriptional activator
MADFSILGPLRVMSSDVELRIGGLRQQRLLAVLLLNPDRAVTFDRIVDELWDDAPRSARQQVHNSIAELRRTLASVDCQVVTTAVGYQLKVPRADVDAHRFRLWVQEAKSAEQQGDLAEAIRLLTLALELWKGDALAGLQSPCLLSAAAMLTEERLTAVERLISLRVANGNAAAVVGELQSLVSEHPLRESLRGSLMIALNQCGRPAEALAVFDEGKRLLADELGLDPSPQLQSVQLEILKGKEHGGSPDADRAVAAPSGTGRSPELDVSVSESPWCALPHDILDFSGRSQEIKDLLAEARQQRTTALVISAIDGMGGVGKTTLATHLAHLVAGEYPDGQYFVNLHGFSVGIEPVAPEQALGRLLRAAGMPPELIPPGLEERSAAWRSRLAGKRVLLVLDNATDSAQVRPLIPGTPTALVIVTSRRKLGSVDGSVPVSLELLPENDAVTLFERIVGDSRVVDEPHNVAKAVELCGRLPLAIRIAAARLRDRTSWTVGDLVNRLDTQARRARFLQVEGRNVMAVLNLSYRYLTEQQQRLFRLLGLHPGTDFDAYSAAALAGMSIEDAESSLEVLFDFNLLRQSAANRFYFHDLVRDCAIELRSETDSDSDEQRALRDLFDYYVHAVYSWCTRLDPISHVMKPASFDRSIRFMATESRQDAGRALAAELHNIVSLCRLVSTQDWDAPAWQLATMLVPFLKLTNYGDGASELFDIALAAAQEKGDVRGQSACLHAMAVIASERRTNADAESLLGRAIDLSRQGNDETQEALQLVDLGLAYLNDDRLDLAEQSFRAAKAFNDDVIGAALRARISNNLGAIYRDRGEFDRALAEFADSSAWATTSKSLHLTFSITWNIGTLLHLRRDYADAVGKFEEALRVSSESGFRQGEAISLCGLSSVHRSLGNFSTSVQLGRKALDITREFRLPMTECEALCCLGEVSICLGENDQAEEIFKQAASCAGRYGYPRYQARSLEGLAHVFHARGQTDLSEEHWRSAREKYPQRMFEASFSLSHLTPLDPENPNCFRCEPRAPVSV